MKTDKKKKKDIEHRYCAASGLACNWASQIDLQEYLSRLKSIQLPEVILICSKMQTNAKKNK